MYLYGVTADQQTYVQRLRTFNSLSYVRKYLDCVYRNISVDVCLNILNLPTVNDNTFYILCKFRPLYGIKTS